MAPDDPSAPLPPLTRPPALVRGDTIGVVATSYAPRPGWLSRGVKALERAGYNVILDPDVARLRRFQRAEDEQRAESFMGMWLDPRIRGVIAGTGGYGAVRMIPYLEPEIFRRNPKFFCGYSDVTALHLWLMRRADLRVFHGPTVDDLIPSQRDPTMSSLLATLATPRPAVRLGRDVARTVRPGRATGRLTGGNLSLVTQTIGTPYEIDTRDAILFLEETRDPMSFADERLVHLRAAGLLRHVRGIVFGHLSLDRSEEDEFEDFIVDLVSDLGVPIIMDFPAGHEVPNLTLPFGTEVELVADDVTGWLVYREDALVASEPPSGARRLSHPARRRLATHGRMSEHFDLVIIGAGPAGEKGAAQAAYFGKRVCVIERAPKPGGAAVNTGTVPSKTLRETALYFSGLRQRGLYGIDYTVKRDITIADFMYRERAVVESSWALIDDNLKRHQVTTLQGSAHFVDPHTVEVARYHQEPRRITGDVFLVASGSMPARPASVPFDDHVVVDSDTILRLPKIPRNMIVIGGGVIGCEYACTFAALGVRVTLVNARERLLMQLDHEVSETLCARMTARLGIQVLTDTEVSHIETTEDGQYARVTLGDGRVIGAECVLYSAGRQGCTADLALGMAGVKTNAQGYVNVDDYYRTSTPHIYAAGDVIGFPALASTAMEQARVAICHAFDLRYKERISPVLPYGVWTIPEVAMCGETEESARSKGLSFEIGKSSFRINPRGQIIGDTEGFVKLVFRPEDQRLLGVSIVGEGACELIHVGMACMMYQGTIDFFIQSVFNYPTLSDAYKYAAYDGLQRLAKRVSGRTGLPSIGSD